MARRLGADAARSTNSWQLFDGSPEFKQGRAAGRESVVAEAGCPLEKSFLGQVTSNREMIARYVLATFGAVYELVKDVPSIILKGELSI
jgi:hypothetical protein